MAHSCLRLRLILTALFLTLDPTRATAQERSVHVVVYNRAFLPGPTVALAQEFVAGIYVGAGVRLLWQVSNGGAAVARVPWRTESIIIAPHGAVFRSQPVRDLLGFTPRSRSGRVDLAYVLASRVDSIARGYDVRPAVVLAAAMAHELGHLLMPNVSHSRVGLMRAGFNQADFRRLAQGTLRFSPVEASTIRARLNADEPSIVQASATRP